MITSSRFRFIRLLFLVSVAATLAPGLSRGQSGNSVSTQSADAETATVQLKASSECSSNVLKLEDVATLKGNPKTIERWSNLPIAPSPRAGTNQCWTREEIEKVLVLRGVSPSQIRWEGSYKCMVSRAERSRAAASVGANETQSANASHGRGALSPSTNVVPAQAVAPIDKSKYTSAFTTPATVAQAERVVTTVIESYLQTKTDSNTPWKIKPIISTELAPRFTQRNQIVGIAGGSPPYDGEQHFELIVKGPTGEVAIPVAANIELPELVYAATKQLAKGHVLREEDVELIPIPRGFQETADLCFQSLNELVGKQLRRSMSAKQVIRQQDAGQQNLVHAGDAVQLEVVVGGVVVTTNGRAIESGGLDDLIQVESIHQKKRLTGRVRDERTVEVVSQGNASFQGNVQTNGRGQRPLTSTNQRSKR